MDPIARLIMIANNINMNKTLNELLDECRRIWNSEPSKSLARDKIEDYLLVTEKNVSPRKTIKYVINRIEKELGITLDKVRCLKILQDN